MTKQLTIAAVVLIVAITPTWLDAYQAFSDPKTPPQVRTYTLIWYLIVFSIALMAWKMFD